MARVLCAPSTHAALALSVNRRRENVDMVGSRNELGCPQWVRS